MAHRHIFFDKTEIVLAIVGSNNVTNVNVRYNQITSIRIERVPVRKMLFLKGADDVIIIKQNGADEPYKFFRRKEKQYFDEYVRDMTEFATKNKLTFTNTL